MTSTNQITTINPTTEEKISTFEIIGRNQVDRKIQQSKIVFSEWKKSYESRRGYVYNLAQYLRKNKSALAKVVTQEMGKIIREAEAEVEKCAWAMEYYADHGINFISDEIVNTDARKSFVSFEPLGTIGSIMPWNFPYWQAMRFAAPAILAGNTIVMKPSSVTPQCGLELEKAFVVSGFPEGVFQVAIGNYTTANHLIDGNINAVTFTGSTNAGSQVAQRAASNLKKCLLELGGSDPFIVCSDADIEKASDGAVKGRFLNCGQSCIASKRFIVTKKVANEFIEKFVSNASKLKIGDPQNQDTDMGPLVNKAGLETISEIVEDAKKKGAEILLGGFKLDRKGYYYSPTILANVKAEMKVVSEETFGPVAPISVVEDEKEAVRLANDSEFGLGASIWTQNLEKAEKMSRQIESGVVSVNNVVISDPRVPFGGIKNSGFGRELSRYGMLEFVNIKSVRFYDNLIHEHYVE